MNRDRSKGGQVGTIAEGVKAVSGGQYMVTTKSGWGGGGGQSAEGGGGGEGKGGGGMAETEPRAARWGQRAVGGW